MGILSGYKRFKKYLRTGEGYKLCSEWTKSDSVEMADGGTLQESMDNVACDVENAKNRISDMHDELMTSLGGMTFGVDAAGRYGYIKAGADTVTPFKSGAQIFHFAPTWVVESMSTNDFNNAQVSINGSTISLINSIGGTSGQAYTFSVNVRTSKKYAFPGCLNFAFSISTSTDGSTYNNIIPVKFGNKSIMAHGAAGFSYNYSEYYDTEDSKPTEGDGYIHATIISAPHTTGYPSSRVSVDIRNFTIIH